jgi:hypothetical protein
VETLSLDGRCLLSLDGVELTWLEIRKRTLIYLAVVWACSQDMEKGGALEGLTTVEIVKILVDTYVCSDAAYSAAVSIQQLSSTVSPHIRKYKAFIVCPLHNLGTTYKDQDAYKNQWTCSMLPGRF